MVATFGIIIFDISPRLDSRTVCRQPLRGIDLFRVIAGSRQDIQRVFAAGLTDFFTGMNSSPVTLVPTTRTQILKFSDETRCAPVFTILYIFFGWYSPSDQGVLHNVVVVQVTGHPSVLQRGKVPWGRLSWIHHSPPADGRPFSTCLATFACLRYY